MPFRAHTYSFRRTGRTPEAERRAESNPTGALSAGHLRPRWTAGAASAEAPAPSAARGAAAGPASCGASLPADSPAQRHRRPRRGGRAGPRGRGPPVHSALAPTAGPRRAPLARCTRILKPKKAETFFSLFFLQRAPPGPQLANAQGEGKVFPPLHPRSGPFLPNGKRSPKPGQLP